MPESSLTWRSDGFYMARWRKRRVRGTAGSTRALLDALSGWEAPAEVNALVRAFPPDPAARSYATGPSPLAPDELKAFFHASTRHRAEVEGRLTRLRSLLDGDEIRAYLADRFLDVVGAEPSLPTATLPLSALEDSVSASSESYAWVPPSLVLRSSEEAAPANLAAATKAADDALLGGTDPAAWLREVSSLGAPVRVSRVSGQRGPMYELVSGARQVTVARLLDLPVILAAVTESPLPRAVTCVPRGVGDRATVAELCRLWQGLLQHGLIEGRYEERAGSPVLHLSGTLPPRWVLGPAETAALSMAAYERLYPGTAERLGIPPAAFASSEHWRQWITTGRIAPATERLPLPRTNAPAGIAHLHGLGGFSPVLT